MPTDDTSTQGTDASTGAHQDQTDGQNAQAHSEQSGKTENTFDPRRAFDSTNEKVNKLAAKFEGFEPALITKVANALGLTKEEAKEEVENQSPDVKAIVQGELWNSQNAPRIADANKNGKYDAYLKGGVKPDLALRLAEQDEGIRIDTSEQTRQRKVSSAEASVDRSGPPAGNFVPGKFISEADIAKYGEKASKVQVFR